MTRRIAFVAAFTLVGAASGVAQQTAAGNFGKLRQTPAYKQETLASAYKTTAWLNATCPVPKASIGDQLGVLAMPVIVNEKGQPQSGSWVEHVTVEGCRRPWRLNVVFQVLRPGSVKTFPGLPGSTRAEPVLQKDAAFRAFIASRADPTVCKSIYISDTRYVGPLTETPIVPGKPGWSEVWTVAHCDKESPIEMRFTPDPTGTTIAARVAPGPTKAAP